MMFLQDIQGGSVNAAGYIVLGPGGGSWLKIYEWTYSGTEGHLLEKEQPQEERGKPGGLEAREYSLC